MIRFSTRSHYGLRVMVDLSVKYGGAPVPLTDIARAEKLSPGYLEHLMVQLRAAGLVEGTKGVRGGYRLAAGPANITIGSVLRALEGPVAPITCASEITGGNYCEREGDCPSHQVWRRVRDSLAQVLDSMTLADVIKSSKEEKGERMPQFQPNTNAVSLAASPVIASEAKQSQLRLGDCSENNQR